MLIYDECAADIGPVGAVEHRQIQIDQRRELHPARGVHHDVDSAEFAFRPVEYLRHRGLVGDVPLGRHRYAPGAANGFGGVVGLGGIRREIQDNREPVSGKTFGARAADAARTARYHRDPRGPAVCGCHRMLFLPFVGVIPELS
ncbi:hypothetical protein IFM12276_62650 [Nocardia sputorum]|uniref:Uncharacterized protein n=1 Tax=Nocardia sputorum TaxID=2984338 RepID=A0ABM8D707_9NOCA|nr:hypothetical protein IFM12276_62650 [Nocardia sputorum]